VLLLWFQHHDEIIDDVAVITAIVLHYRLLVRKKYPSAVTWLDRLFVADKGD
jgi:hypothetical protein